MKNKKYIFIIIILGLTFLQSTNIFAQRTVFRTDPEQFINDFFSFAKESGKEGLNIFNDFKNRWDSLYFEESDRKQIVQSLNAILKKNGQMSPHIENYLKTLYAFHQIQHPIESYREWADGNEKILQKYPIAHINIFLTNSYNLLTKNILDEKGHKIWTHSASFVFVNKQNKLQAHFEQGMLIGKIQEDSTFILDTQGDYLLMENVWEGVGGKITWQKAGFEPDMRYATLTKYEIKLNGSTFEAEKVNLTDNYFGLAGIDGKLEDKISPLKYPMKSTYPQFVSYNDDLKISNIFEMLNFQGGFSSRGRKAYIFVDKAAKADMWVTKNKEIIGHLRSKSFVLDSATISSQLSSLEIKADTSSVFHPGISFTMLIPSPEEASVTFFRSTEGMASAPFYDNNHLLDIYADIALWFPFKNELSFKNGVSNSNGEVYYRSLNFFDPNDPLLKGLYPKHPVFMLNEFGGNEFEAREFARFLQKPVDQVVFMLLELSFKGIIEFDLETKKAVLLPRFYTYLEALRGKKDYDNMQMVSNPKGISSGAIYDLNKGSLKLNALQPIPLSNKQQVIVKPDSNSITLNKGRDFSFDGTFSIGYFLFKGKDFSFFYDDFKINLDSVDYMQIYVPNEKADSLQRRVNQVLNKIEKIRGDILIDDPGNKSGLQDFTDYPILTTYDTSYVYYDQVVQPAGIYNREEFFFMVYPFKIDSLGSFTTKGFNLLGEFHSDSIFPVFKNVDLVIQPDLSLGFNKPSSEKGDSLYGGKALFFNEIVLNSLGLNARGTIQYLTSKTTSSQFQFYPDSMITKASNFEIIKQTVGYQFPSLLTDSIYIQWYPKSDSLWANNANIIKQKFPILVFDEKTNFGGKLLLQPNGLKGSGAVEVNNGRLSSEKFKFKSDAFTADTADFVLKMDIQPGEEEFSLAKEPDFETKNVFAEIDMKQRIGKLKSNGAESYIFFPQNMFLCYMSEMIWYMDKKLLDLSSAKPEEDSTSVEALSARFVSTNPKQDSLEFFARSSSFDAMKKEIWAKGVDSIPVANASIYTSDGNVYIEKKAKIKTLDNTKIKTEKFEFFNATATIEGKFSFFGSGFYNFIDEIDSIQMLAFNDIKVDSAKNVVANGQIAREQKFKLSPVYDYYGKIIINTFDSIPFFNGHFKIVHQCDKLKVNPIAMQYIPMAAFINPDSIYIPITDINHENAPYAATLVTIDSTHVYSAFLNDIKWWSDQPIMKADQMLYYNKTLSQFNLSNPEKLKNPELRGNFVSLNKNYCNIYSQGDIDLGLDYGQMKINAAGELFHAIEQNRMSINLSFGLNFYFHQPSLDAIYNTFQQEPTLQAIDLTSLGVQQQLKQLTNDNVLQGMFSELSSTGAIQTVPNEFAKTLFFSDVKLVWNKETQSYVSEGPIGIGFIGGKPVNKKVTGIIEMTKKKSGNLLNIYIEASPNKWYFFTYSRNVLRTFSSDATYNTTIANLEGKENIMPVERNQTPFSFLTSSERIKSKFLYRIMQGELEEEEEEEEMEE